MIPRKTRSWLRPLGWTAGVLLFVAGTYRLQAQPRPTPAAVMKARIRAAQRPRPAVIFNDVSPRPTSNNLSQANFVGYKVCAGCHGALNSTRRTHTIIEEWEAASNPHAKDGARLGSSGTFNVYTVTVGDGVPANGTKSCATCHTTGAPEYDQPQVATRGGFDPSLAFNDHVHNTNFLRVQCENCHGPGSLHVRSGGSRRLINRVPDPKETCWRCHVHTPNEKGNTLSAPATDEQIALYSSSLTRPHNPGALIAGQGGYEYPGEDYSAGRNNPHTRIRTTCVTCHTPRDRRSPILDHSNLHPRMAACRNCHLDARNVASLEDWSYLHNRRETVKQLLIQLGGANASGEPNANASGGLLGNAADKTSLEYKRARWNYMLVFGDSSLGAHNFDYALELLLTSITNAPAQNP